MLPLKKRSMAGAMQHQNVRRSEKRPVDGQITYRNPPIEPSGHVQVSRNRNNYQQNFQNQVDEDNITLITDEPHHELGKPRT